MCWDTKPVITQGGRLGHQPNRYRALLGVPRAPDTNVRIPHAARDALLRVAGRWRQSLDETMRRLLSEHLAASVDDGLQRLTHISTVMRYPLPLPGRNQPRQGVQLRLRLDEGVADRARAVSLRLPGQGRVHLPV